MDDYRIKRDLGNLGLVGWLVSRHYDGCPLIMILGECSIPLRYIFFVFPSYLSCQSSLIQRSHDEAVALIAADVRKFYDRKEQFRICYGSTNSTRESQRSRYRSLKPALCLGFEN